MAYTIQISEAQREFLAKALELLDLDNQELDAIFEKHNDAPHEEIDMLRAMLEDLPRQEAECPGCLHGLCL